MNVSYITTEDGSFNKKPKFVVKKWAPSKNLEVNRLGKLLKYLIYLYKTLFSVIVKRNKVFTSTEKFDFIGATFSVLTMNIVADASYTIVLKRLNIYVNKILIPIIWWYFLTILLLSQLFLKLNLLPQIIMVLSFIIYNLILKEQIVYEIKKIINHFFKSKVFYKFKRRYLRVKINYDYYLTPDFLKKEIDFEFLDQILPAQNIKKMIETYGERGVYAGLLHKIYAISIFHRIIY